MPVPPWIVLVGGLALALGPAVPLRAQLGRSSIPSVGYHAAFADFYDGEYARALQRFTMESRDSAIRIGQGRWIDSICYETMIGECHYEMGNLALALDHYTNALTIYTAYPRWMLQVQFPMIGPGAPKPVPWGIRPTQGKLGRFPPEMKMASTTLGVARPPGGGPGGAIMQNTEFRLVEVQEIVRCTALALRRRARILGPVASQDPLFATVRTNLQMGAGPPNHWSQAWVDLQIGLAVAAEGRDGQAVPYLQRATLAGGEFEHPLTAVAHLELGRLAMVRGDYAVALQHFEEASYAAFYYPDLGVLEEAFRYGALAHMLADRKGVFPPLVPAIAWAKVNRCRHLYASLMLSAAENYVVMGQTPQAAVLLEDARAAVFRRSMAAGRIGARRQFLAATVFFQQAKVREGEAALALALDFMRNSSHWLFHIGLVDKFYTSGGARDALRTAMGMYETVLRDPLPIDWASDPMESLAVLTVPHVGPYEHWFEATLSRSREHEKALEIADRIRRHRFFTSLPLGGRLESLRWVLEAPADRIAPEVLLQRQDLLARYPAYQKLRQEAIALREKLAAMPLAPREIEAQRRLGEGLAQLAALGWQQEIILREMAVRREPAEMVFPPLRQAVEIQRSLPKGHAMLVFFATSRSLYGFLLNKDRYDYWQVAAPAVLGQKVVAVLRDMGNYQQSRELTLDDLTGKAKWKQSGRELLDLLLKGSRADFTKKFDELIVVPDGALWYLPFEALQVAADGQSQPLIARVRVRYAPTASLATAPRAKPHRPTGNIAVVAGKLHPREDDALVRQGFEQLAAALPDAVALRAPLPAASSLYGRLFDRLVVLDDLNNLAGDLGAYGWSPVTLDRGKPGSRLADWMALPWGGPDEMIFPGFHTAAEEALRRTTRAPGHEVFLSVCGLMSTGTRTVLLSRWRTGGQSSRDLVREFAQELPHTTPADAWQRAVLVLAGSRLNLEAEPRIKKTSTDEAPKANHPFFWAGYMLVDSGCPAPQPEAPKPGPVLKIKPPDGPEAKPKEKLEIPAPRPEGLEKLQWPPKPKEPPADGAKPGVPEKPEFPVRIP